jgi:alpha-tubulin suppressor-like RCC1 family protein
MRTLILIALGLIGCGDSLRSMAPPAAASSDSGGQTGSDAGDGGGNPACAGTTDSCGTTTCVQCGAAPANALSMQCLQSQCFYECSPGFLKCDSGCCTASAIAAGGSTSCAIVGGAVRCWGSNSNGQLGFAGASKSAVPVQIPGISGATRIAVGGSHACAIAGGQVFCWGGNAKGQLGQSGADSPTPLAVSGVSSPNRITAGDQHSCAVSVSGTVTCWGADDAGQTTVPAITASLIAAGMEYTCGLVSGGAVRCWGQGSANPLAAGASALAAGAGHTCAIASGDVQCWGAGVAGQLGDGNSADSATPVKVNGISGPTGPLGAGGAHSCAVVSAGGSSTNLYCWGSNGSGQLGLGNFSNQPQAAPLGLAAVVELSLGTSHTCARLGSGGVECWGANDQGQAGSGTSDLTVTAPAFVTGK